MSHVVVIGSGIAGLVAAVKASAKHDVTLITKDELAESNTHYAQGGIASVTSTDDTIAEHIADTLFAGAGLCFEPAVEALCQQGPNSINELIAFGVEFDRAQGELARGLEAAHSHPRILHVGGDATGAGISNALVQTLKTSKVNILEFTLAIDLLIDAGKVTGVKTISADGESIIDADKVILASGGAGQLYRHTTNPHVTTGDGVALALRAGAELADLEFYQFHPTALAVPGSFLISEAVRGEGAVLINNSGQRFMQSIHELAELAPRDIVARGIQSEMRNQGGQPVLLDATHLGGDFLAKRFPSINRACRSFGLDWSKHPIPVTPAAHYWMGGVATDTYGRTSIDGLFAVGEVGCNGTHGANRLASNSLLESVVYADRAIEVLDQKWPESVAKRFEIQQPIETIEIEISEPPTAHTASKKVVDRVELQTLMWDNVGLVREGELLAEALLQFNAWRPSSLRNRVFSDYEDANLLDLATALTASALGRLESRGAHYRSDYPQTSANLARPIVVKRKA